MRRFTVGLFYLLITELALGGGGRLTAIGPISLRMVLFALALLVTIIHLIKGKRIPTHYIRLIIFFLIVSGIALLRGIYSGASRGLWWEDIKPLLYFLILPFFSLAISDTIIINRASSLLKASGVIQAIIFFIILLVIHLHIVPFLSIYKPLIATEEFFFRGEITFTYKGFLFLCISFLFFHFTGGRYRPLLMAVLLVAILLTVTRGFWVALLGTYAVYYFLQQKIVSKIKSGVFALLAVAVMAGGQIFISKTSETIDLVKSNSVTSTTLPRSSPPKSTLLGDRAYSDQGRFQQIKEVLSAVTFSSVVAGHGFGNGVPTRPVHMEISYLEIFHKQGLMGLAFWAYLLWMLFIKYVSAPHRGTRDAFFFSSLFIFIQSLTNQYINNPIGLSFILLSLVCLDNLNRVNDLK